MNLQNVLIKPCISFDQNLRTKNEVFDYLIQQFSKQGIVQCQASFKKAVQYRESLSETGLEHGVAIPHGVDGSVQQAAIAYVRLRHAIPWESMDDQPIRHVFLLAIPENRNDVHIRMLSELARSLIKEDVIDAINKAQTAEELLSAISVKGGK